MFYLIIYKCLLQPKLPIEQVQCVFVLTHWARQWIVFCSAPSHYENNGDLLGAGTEQTFAVFIQENEMYANRLIVCSDLNVLNSFDPSFPP